MAGTGDDVTGALTVLLQGALTGAGVWLVVIGLVPARRPLTDVLAAALSPPRPAAPLLVTRQAQGWTARAGRPFAPFLAGFGLPRAAVRADLAVLERPPQQHLAEQATAALAGFLLGPALAAITAAFGLSLPWQIPVWGGLLLAVAGFVGPDVGVRGDAQARREEFRHALSAFLDLAVISLAGGAGLDGALDDAAQAGSGWGFRQLRRSVDTARLTSVPPWETLGRLGERLDIPELVELAAGISLAGSEGAKIRVSLAARAATLRAHALSDAEAAAQSATERMSLPVVLLFGGFLIFVSYPAFQTVVTSL